MVLQSILRIFVALLQNQDLKDQKIPGSLRPSAGCVTLQSLHFIF